MVYPDFDDDELFDIEGLKRLKHPSERTEGENLQRFKRFFDSSSRAMLQDCLFRVIDHEDGTGTLEILCPTEAVMKRFTKKYRKIWHTINTCWSHIRQFSLCVQLDGELRCEHFTRNCGFRPKQL